MSDQERVNFYIETAEKPEILKTALKELQEAIKNDNEELSKLLYTIIIRVWGITGKRIIELIKQEIKPTNTYLIEEEPDNIDSKEEPTEVLISEKVGNKHKLPDFSIPGKHENKKSVNVSKAVLVNPYHQD